MAGFLWGRIPSLAVLRGAKLNRCPKSYVSQSTGAVVGAPWVNGPSSVRVREDGRITVTIRGLVLTPSNINPFGSVVATLVCDNKIADSTAPFALTTGLGGGDGSTSEKISVPRQCDNPAVLIQPASNLKVYIASAFGEDD